jgi:hypothetical protein
VASRITCEPEYRSIYRKQKVLLVLAEIISSTLKMEAICSSETSVATEQITRRHIPEDDTLHNHSCENLKSYQLQSLFFWRRTITHRSKPQPRFEASTSRIWLHVSPVGKLIIELLSSSSSVLLLLHLNKLLCSGWHFFFYLRIADIQSSENQVSSQIHIALSFFRLHKKRPCLLATPTPRIPHMELAAQDWTSLFKCWRQQDDSWNCSHIIFWLD